jgi:FkbM family methyltransferase
MKKITDNPFISAFLKNKYRDFVLKPALKILQKNQKNAECFFWTMPYDSICQAIILNGFYERELLQGMCALVLDKNSIALDVGANIGNHSLFFSKKFDSVVSFEPMASNCLLLKANLFLNQIKNVTLIEKALSNQISKMGVFYDNPKNTNNIICALNERDENQIIVEVAIGDEEIEKLSLKKKIGLIKIDVEGHEPFVIEGLRKPISSHQPIIFWEAFNRLEAEKTKNLLEKMDYGYFYHLTTIKYQSRFLSKIKKSFTNSTYLVELDKCNSFDGMNVASSRRLI